MPVSNIDSIGIGGRTRPKPIPIHHLIPPVADSDMKVVIESTTDHDLSDLILSGSYSDGVTNTVGAFDFKIIDPDKAIYNAISTFDEVVVYADYGTPTNARFRGIIEKLGFADSYLIISGRSVGMIFAEKNIIYQSTDVDGNLAPMTKSDILKEIIEDNFDDINVDDVVVNSTEITVNYFEIPFASIIEDLCGTTHSFYLDTERAAQYFVKDSITNTTEIVVEDSNLLETLDNADDSNEVYSRVRVYGANLDGIPIIATSESDTSNTGGIEKDLKIDNASATTTTQAQESADLEFEKLRNIPKIGQIKSLFLPTLIPGERIFISSPREGIDPAYYSITSYTQSFDLNGDAWAKTTIDLVRRKQSISGMMRERINFEDFISENLNKNDMDYSVIYDFSEGIGTHSDTEIDIDNGVLTTDGSATGTWISPTTTLTTDTSAVEVRVKGNKITGTKVFISVDNGVTYTPIQTLGQSQALTGKNIVLKIVLNSADTEVTACGILYKF